MLFDWLGRFFETAGQVCKTNPATAVRGPKLSVSGGKSPVPLSK